MNDVSRFDGSGRTPECTPSLLRYCARDEGAAVLIAQEICEALGSQGIVLSTSTYWPSATESVNSVYDRHLGILPLIERGELPNALLAGSDHSPEVGLFSCPMDDALDDSGNVRLKVRIFGLDDPLEISIPHSYLVQMQPEETRLEVLVPRYMNQLFQHVRRYVANLFSRGKEEQSRG